MRAFAAPRIPLPRGVQPIGRLMEARRALGTARWHREKQSKERLQETLRHAGGAIVTTDRGGKIVFLNAAAQLLFGLSSDEAIGQPIGSAVFLLQNAGRPEANFSLQQALVDDEINALPNRLILVSKSGQRHRAQLTVSRIVNIKGQTTGAVILLHGYSSCEDAKPTGLAAVGRVELPAQSC